MVINMSKELQKKDEAIQALYIKIQQLIQTARDKVYKAANFEMVKTYWEIGKRIVKQEQQGEERAEYGKYLIKELSKRLQSEFETGFDERNLRNMRLFYQRFPKWNAVRSELSWTHYRILIRVENHEARAYYQEEAIREHWSYRALERQITTLYYERLLATKHKRAVMTEAEEKTKDLKLKPEELIKDPYMLEFLDMHPDLKYLEKDIEQGLIDKLHDFLLELGKGFSFVARQKRITVDGDHYYIDLVFYNFKLKCFVLIDLKTGKLTNGDIGQMDFYVKYYEKEEREVGDNPTIGIILCTDKNDAMVRYTLLDESKQIFASKYMVYLPTENELRQELLREKQLIELEKRDQENKPNSSRNE